MDQQIIVIGGGLGGLSAAAELLSKGAAVTLLEKNETLGGRAGAWQEGGYTWPSGATAVLEPALYERPFRAAGRDPAGYFTMRRLAMPCFWQQDKTAHFYAGDAEVMLERLSQTDERECGHYLAYLADGEGRFRLRSQYERYAPAKSSDERTLKGYGLSQPLEDWLTFLAAYPGGRSRDLRVQDTWQPAVMQLEGIWHIDGGLSAYAQALARLVRELGGTIHTGEAAEEIVLAGGRVVGVRSRQGLYLADAVVCAIDQPAGIKKLLPQLRWDEEEWQASCGIFALHLLVDGHFPKLAAHNLISGKKLTPSLEGAYKGNISRRPPLYLYRPAALDAQHDGWEQLTVYCRVPNQLLRPKRWTAREKNKLIRHILSVLTQIPALDELPQTIRAMACITPTDMQKNWHTSGGAAFGPARCHGQAPQVAGLYWAGDWAAGRAGVHQVLAHSQRVSQTLLAQLAQDLTRELTPAGESASLELSYT